MNMIRPLFPRAFDNTAPANEIMISNGAYSYGNVAVFFDEKTKSEIAAVKALQDAIDGHLDF